jgi:hypothetical protein
LLKNPAKKKIKENENITQPNMKKGQLLSLSASLLDVKNAAVPRTQNIKIE